MIFQQPSSIILKVPPYFYPPHPVGAHITVVTTDEAHQHGAALEVEVTVISFFKNDIAVGGGEEGGVRGDQGQGELPQEGELWPGGQV